MLGFLLTLLITASIIFSIFSGSCETLAASVTEGASSAVRLCISLCSAMALWGGVMKVAEECGITRVIIYAARLPVKLLFGKLRNEELERSAAMNITANLLGLGNAAVPFCLRSMKLLCRDRQCTRKHIAYLVLLNTASIQLIPATVAAMRQAHGADDPWDCVLPTVIASTAALAVGLITAAAISPERKETE